MALGAVTTVVPGQSYAVELMASAVAANNPPAVTGCLLVGR